MVKFTATIKKFAKKADKTGWTYIEITAAQARKLKPGIKKIFHVKGKLDSYVIKRVALLPMGEGAFILPLNAAMRKGTGKKQGDTLQIELEEDKSEFKMNATFLQCLRDEPDASRHFKTLTPSHQRYFSKWIDSAKTDATKTQRIAMAVSALARGWDYGLMLRNGKPRNV